MQYHQLPYQVQYLDLPHKSAERRLDRHKFRRCRYLGQVGRFRYQLHRCRFLYRFRKRPQGHRRRRPYPQLMLGHCWNRLLGTWYLVAHRRQYRYQPMGLVGKRLGLLHSLGQRQLDHHTYRHHQCPDWLG